jgi:hypothetical protein
MLPHTLAHALPLRYAYATGYPASHNSSIFFFSSHRDKEGESDTSEWMQEEEEEDDVVVGLFLDIRRSLLCISWSFWSY